MWSFYPWQLAAAFGLDLILGDPHHLPHPVRWMGRLIAHLESVANDRNYSAGRLRLTGFVVWVMVVATVLIVTMWLQAVSWLAGVKWNWAVMVWLAYASLSVRSLHLESRRVVRALERRDLDRARNALAKIVSRDTSDLDRQQILRAALETVAENITDGIVAPMLFLAFGGPIAAMGYKAVNTMDSMIGYENESYRYFGWFAAKADDLANWVPARVTGLLLVLAAALRGLDWHAAWRIMRRDAGKMKSPNAGYSEAAAAGALGIRLGGVNVYFGERVEKPGLGNSIRGLDMPVYRQLVQLMYLVAVLSLALALIVRMVIFHL